MIPLLLFLAALMLLLFASGTGWSDVLSSRRNELVFEGRNHDYGAYRMRREHHRVMILSFLAATGLGAALVGAPKLFPTEPSAREIPWVEVSDSTIYVSGPVPDEPERDPETRPRRSNEPIIDPSSFTAIDSVPDTPIDTTTVPAGPGDDGAPRDTSGTSGPIGGGGGLTPVDTIPLESWMATEPEYPGGRSAFYKDLHDVIRYPEIDRDAGRGGKVHVTFVVSEEGRITQVRIAKGVSPTLDAEAVRAVRALRKQWKPGRARNQDVAVWHTLPINFTLRK